MPNQQPTITTVDGGRQFVCFPVAVQAVIINDAEELLLLSSRTYHEDGSWQVVSGALEAEETVLDGTLREVTEELGQDIRVRPVSVVHVETFHYDEKAQYMIAIYYLFVYESGRIEPGDDMENSTFRWWSLAELDHDSVNIRIPRDHRWLFKRAVDLYRIWNGQSVNLQPNINQSYNHNLL